MIMHRFSVTAPQQPRKPMIMARHPEAMNRGDGVRKLWPGVTSTIPSLFTCSHMPRPSKAAPSI